MLLITINERSAPVLLCVYMLLYEAGSAVVCNELVPAWTLLKSCPNLKRKIVQYMKLTALSGSVEYVGKFEKSQGGDTKIS